MASSEIQIDGQAGGADTLALVAHILGGPGSHIPGGQVSEAGVYSFQVIIPLLFGDLLRRRCVSPAFLGTQTRPSLRRLSLIRVSLDW